PVSDTFFLAGYPSPTGEGRKIKNVAANRCVRGLWVSAPPHAPGPLSPRPPAPAPCHGLAGGGRGDGGKGAAPASGQAPSPPPRAPPDVCAAARRGRGAEQGAPPETRRTPQQTRLRAHPLKECRIRSISFPEMNITEMHFTPAPRNETQTGRTAAVRP